MEKPVEAVLRAMLVLTRKNGEIPMTNGGVYEMYDSQSYRLAGIGTVLVSLHVERDPLPVSKPLAEAGSGETDETTNTVIP